MLKLKHWIIGALFLVPLFGCALGTDHVKLSYVAETQKEKPGTGQLIYVEKAVDNRDEKDLIGEKRNGYGARLGNVALEKGLDITTIVTSAVTDSLSSYGYNTKPFDEKEKNDASASPKILSISVEDFWVWPVMGFWTVDCQTKAKLEFQLRTKGSRETLWSKKVAVSEKATGMGATTSLFEESINKALASAMTEFQGAISTVDFKNSLSHQNTPGAVEVAQ